MSRFKVGQQVKWTGRNGKERTGIVREVWMYQLVVDEIRAHARTGKPLATKRAHVWDKDARVIGDSEGA